MKAFRVYDPEEKVTWLILNYHVSDDGGSYLAAREEDSKKDGELSILSLKKISKCQFLEFFSEVEE